MHLLKYVAMVGCDCGIRVELQCTFFSNLSESEAKYVVKKNKAKILQSSDYRKDVLYNIDTAPARSNFSA